MNRIHDYRNFAFIWTLIFVFVTVSSWFKNASLPLWSAILAIFFLLVGVFKPTILAKPYDLWMKLGSAIGAVMSRIMLFVLFYFVFTPVAVLLRLLGKDPLNKRIDTDKSSYWIKRDNQPESMRHQF